MWSIAVVALVAVGILAVPLTELQRQSQFSQFITKYSKSYSADEFQDRYNVFKANSQLIENHNAGLGDHTYSMGMNAFGDLTFEEFKKDYTGFAGERNEYARKQNEYKPVVGEKSPKSVDWVTKGAVTPVKNQAQCGSCWAFSTVGAIEGATKIAGGKLLSLSEQQLVDCAGAQGNQGCNGGLMDNGFEYVIKNGGLDTETDYSYTAQDGSCDNKKAGKTNSAISGYKDVKVGSEDDLLIAVSHQPVSIAIEADQMGFQFYKKGVFSGKCGTQLDHGVLLVGYGSTGFGKDYWKIKNSWGNTWGEGGYIRFERGQNKCGLANSASFPQASSTETH